MTDPQPSLPGAVVIALMAKAPLVGQVKTRLAEFLGDSSATDLYARFLEDTLATTRQVRGARVRVVCPDDLHRRALLEIVPGDVEVVPQAEPGLLAGLAWAFRSHFAAGATKVLLVDGDSPTLSPEMLSRAVDCLDAVDLCVGPCPDGGYYLIGAGCDCPGLFDGIAVSTASTLDQTMARARQAGFRTTLLPPCPDVDTADDFVALVSYLETHPAAAVATHAWLKEQGWLGARTR